MLEGHDDGITCIAWSPDDALLLTSAEDCIKLWDVAVRLRDIPTGDRRG